MGTSVCVCFDVYEHCLADGFNLRAIRRRPVSSFQGLLVSDLFGFCFVVYCCYSCFLSLPSLGMHARFKKVANVVSGGTYITMLRMVSYHLGTCTTGVVVRQTGQRRRAM